MKAHASSSQLGIQVPSPLKIPALPDIETVVIGAGPYGLSAGSYFKSKGLDVAIFGEPMNFWATKMPAGMLLRSPREASSISHPRADFTLDAYEEASGTKPLNRVSLETFVAYGMWFQAQLTPTLDRRNVAEVERSGSKFRLTLSDGAVITSRRVVVAAGIGPFKKRPAAFSEISHRKLSHCYDGYDFSELRDRRVAVIGAGQSALESAALLREAGAKGGGDRQNSRAPLDRNAQMVASARPDFADLVFEA